MGKTAAFLLRFAVKIESMMGMIRATKSWLSPAREMTILIWMSGLTFVLYGLHLISGRWVVGIFFLLLIPLATVKAFLDYRRKSI